MNSLVFNVCVSVCGHRQHQEWLKRELLAQQEFRLQMEREDTARKKQEEEEVLDGVLTPIPPLTLV